eukprot:1499880-Amphidinium_carterae.1
MKDRSSTVRVRFDPLLGGSQADPGEGTLAKNRGKSRKGTDVSCEPVVVTCFSEFWSPAVFLGRDRATRGAE